MNLISRWVANYRDQREADRVPEYSDWFFDKTFPQQKPLAMTLPHVAPTMGDVIKVLDKLAERKNLVPDVIRLTFSQWNAIQASVGKSTETGNVGRIQGIRVVVEPEITKIYRGVGE